MLLVDFGESACKFALVKKQEGGLEVRAWEIEDIRSLEYAADHVLEKTKDMRENAEPVLVSLPPMLWRARVSYERIERKNAAARIDEKEKEAIFADLFLKARSRLTKSIQYSSGILAEDIRVHKLEILSYAIDGYAVQDILGFSGARVDVRIMAVFTLVKHLPIVDTILERFSGMPCRVVHCAEALEGFSQTKAHDAIYVDMGDASCRIAVAQDKHVVYVDEIPRGGRDFTLYLQETLSLGENTAKDFKERYAAGDFSFLLREGVKKGFSAIAEDLARLVTKSLRSMAAPLPPSVFLFGGASKLPEIHEVFQSTMFENLPFHEKPQVSFLLPKDLWTVEFPGKTNPTLTPLFFLPYAP